MVMADGNDAGFVCLFKGLKEGSVVTLSNTVVDELSPAAISFDKLKQKIRVQYVLV